MVSRHDRAAGLDAGAYRRAPDVVVRSTLSGMDMPADQFTHNNMVPFYGGSVRQPNAADAYSGRLEAFTGEGGARAMGPRRQERAPMFSPHQTDFGGMGAEDVRAAYLASMPAPRNRAHEAPAPQQVGRPGVSVAGATGDVYYDARQAVLPKGVDDLRPATRPRTTYEGRVLPGGVASGGVQRPQQPHMAQQRQNTVTERGPGDLLRTTGAVVRPAVRPAVEAKQTSRQDTTRAYVGAAGSAASTSAASGRAPRPVEPRDPMRDRSSLRAPAPGPAGVTGPSGVTDYGRESIAAPRKEDSVARGRLGTLTGALKALVAPLQDMIRQTRKEEMVDAPRAFGNPGAGGASGVMPKMTVYDSADVARTTMREAGLVEAPRANLRGPALRGTVHDPEDVLRTTLKQAGLAEAPAANLRGPVHRGSVHDPEDTMRTTLKQATMVEAPMANLRGPAHRLTVFDPEDVARATLKETGIVDATGAGVMAPPVFKGQAVMDEDPAARATCRQTLGAVSSVRHAAPGAVAHPAYDVDDWAPGATLKQMAAEAGRGGPVDGHVGALSEGGLGGYAGADVVAPVTQRQVGVDSDYFGNMQSGVEQSAGAYGLSPDDIPRTTQRVLAADSDYFGTGGAHIPGAVSYVSAQAAEVDPTRELLQQGRVPTASSVKVAAGVEATGLAQRMDPQRSSTLYAGGGALPALPVPTPTGDLLGDGTRGIVDRSVLAELHAASDRMTDNIAAATTQLGDNPYALKW